MSRYINVSLPISWASPLRSRAMPRASARGVRSARTSSTIGANSIWSLQGTLRSSLISSSVFVICDIFSVCSCRSSRKAASSHSISGCSAENSSTCACMSASGVRSSCAAFPVNCRCALKPSSRRSIMLLNDLLNCWNSGSTSSLIFMSAKLLGCTFSTCDAKARSGLSARPLTKYASTPPSSVTATVISQLVALKDSCALLTTIVSSSSSSRLSGSNDAAAPPSTSAHADMPLPIESM